MAIRYKVVTLGRKSVFMCDRGKVGYIVDYKKNTVVTAPKNTFGMMVFETKSQAKYWMRDNNIPTHRQKILRVESVGRGKRPKMLPSFNGFNAFYERFDELQSLMFKIVGFMYIGTMSVPIGTLCYQKLKVLT